MQGVQGVGPTAVRSSRISEVGSRGPRLAGRAPVTPAAIPQWGFLALLTPRHMSPVLHPHTDFSKLGTGANDVGATGLIRASGPAVGWPWG